MVFLIKKYQKRCSTALAALCTVCMLATGIDVYGAESMTDNSGAPLVEAESAILMDVDSGAVLYAKNVHAKQYPASITKILTCLLAKENAAMDETVEFSNEAVFGIERGSSNIGIDVGETLTVEQCLYGTLLASANEVASALGEHVSGSQEEFAKLMNARAKELGCTDSNFVNANGLPNENHYTSAYDMALIGRAFFSDEVLSSISGTISYHIPASATQPDDIDLMNHHRMLPGCMYGTRYSYEYTVGGKTGYTVAAGQTLVTCAEKDGMRLVCVVLKDVNKAHYTDSTALFDYGFEAFQKIADTDVLSTENQKTLIEENLGPVSYEAEEGTQMILPKDVSLEDVSTVFVNSADTDNAAQIDYIYKNQVVGSTVITYQKQTEEEEPDFQELQQSEAEHQEKEKKPLQIFFWILSITVLLIVIAGVGICSFVVYRRYQMEKERKNRRREIMERHRRMRDQQDEW